MNPNQINKQAAIPEGATTADPGKAPVKPGLEEKPGNGFTTTLRPDLPATPEEVLAEVTEDSTGKRMSTDEQIEFINNLPPEMLNIFAMKVKQHMEQAVAAEQEAKKKPQYVTDFSVLPEKSIFDLSVPIQAIDHQVPEYLKLTLKDPNYSPRWIQTGVRRLGQARAQGWSYITQEDLAQQLGIEITADAAGHFVYIDTVAMKISKQKLFSQLRANFQRAIIMTQQAKLHEKMKSVIEQEIQNAADPESGLPFRDQFIHYRDKNAMNVYSPLG